VHACAQICDVGSSLPTRPVAFLGSSSSLFLVPLQYNTAQTTTVLGKAERMEETLGGASTSQELSDKYQEFVAGGK